MLKVINLKKKFNSNLILDGVDFEIGDGEICVLLGLNGVGKTTLIKTILGLLKADGGEIFIDKKIMYLPENFQPNENLKGKEFLYFFNENITWNEILRLCNLLNFDVKYLEQYVSKYSKGTVQKLGLISTFLSNVKLLILDEPLSGLDITMKEAVQSLFVESKNKGQSVFFTTHITDGIEKFCTRIMILKDGKTKFVDDLKNVKW